MTAGLLIVENSDNNLIAGNTIRDRGYVGFVGSNGNVLYHNNFLEREYVKILIDETSVNITWDDGYPSGGNYWSNYTGVDFYKGPYQNITGSDGIGDTPYTIDLNNTDNYPFINPWPPSNYTLTITATYGGTTSPSPGTYTYIEETTVQVTATPRISYVLDYWELNGSTEHSNPINVTMNSDHTLHAVFKYIVPPPSIGGISIPVNKLELLAPYIGLSVLLAAALVTVVYVKKRKRNTEINSQTNNQKSIKCM